MNKNISDILDCIEYYPLPVRERITRSEGNIIDATMQKIKSEKTSVQSAYTKPYRPRRGYTFTQVAASLLIVAAVIAVLMVNLFNRGEEPHNDIVSLASPPPSSPPAESPIDDNEYVVQPSPTPTPPPTLEPTPTPTSVLPHGEIMAFEYGENYPDDRAPFAVEVSNVIEARIHEDRDDGGNLYRYSHYILSPGARLVIINADMNDGSFTEHGRPYPNWYIAQHHGERIPIGNDMEPIRITSDMAGIVNAEGYGFVLTFEFKE